MALTEARAPYRRPSDLSRKRPLRRRLDTPGARWHRERVAIGLPLALLAGLLAGPSLGPEHDTDAPVWWPAGHFRDQVVVSDGLLVAWAAGYRDATPWVRKVFSDGGLGPETSLEGNEASRLVALGGGVLALGNGSTFSEPVVGRLFDPATGAPLGPSRVLVGQEVRAVDAFASATAADALLAVMELQPDGGRRLLVGPLSDDGQLLDGGLRAVPLGGELLELRSAHGQHWGLVQETLPDAGRQLTLATLTAQGAASAAATFPAGFALSSALSRPRLTETASAVGVTWQGPGGLRQALVSPQGALLADQALDAGCYSFAPAADGDDVLVACATATTMFGDPSRVSLVRSLPDGGVRHAALVEGDGGTLEVHALTSGPAPQLTLVRAYKELARGHWRSTTLLPLTSDGAQVVGPGVGLARHLARQYAPSLASVGPAGPHALVWYDERRLPEEQVLHGLRLSAEGEALEAPVGVPKASPTAFTTVNNDGRGVASNGRDFLLIDSDGFDVTTIAWPADGGPPASRRDLTAQTGLQYRPLVTGSPSGYLAAWSDFTDWTTRRLGPGGVPVDGSATRHTTTAASADQLWDGSRYRMVVSTADVVRLVDLGLTGAPVDGGVLAVGDGGLWRVRLAKADDVLLVGWQNRVSPTRTEVLTLRVAVDGGAVLDDAPRTWGSPSPQYSVSLWDIGARGGVFYLLGAEYGDAGTKLWTWRLGADGGALDPAPVVFDEPLDARDVVAGPVLPDGGLLIAYSRPHPELSASARLVHWRVLSDGDPPLDGGGGEDAPDGGDPRGLAVYQVGCGCAGVAGLWPAGLLLVLRRRRRSGARG